MKRLLVALVLVPVGTVVGASAQKSRQYCGPGPLTFRTPPAINRACREHDRVYSRYRGLAKYLPGYPSRAIRDADLRLAVKTLLYERTHRLTPSERARLLLIAGYFLSKERVARRLDALRARAGRASADVSRIATELRKFVTSPHFGRVLKETRALRTGISCASCLAAVGAAGHSAGLSLTKAYSCLSCGRGMARMAREARRGSLRCTPGSRSQLRKKKTGAKGLFKRLGLWGRP